MELEIFAPLTVGTNNRAMEIERNHVGWLVGWFHRWLGSGWEFLSKVCSFCFFVKKISNIWLKAVGFCSFAPL